MKLKYINIIFTVLLLLIGIDTKIYSQTYHCGVSNNIPISTNYNSNLNPPATCNPKVQFTIVRSSDGSSGADRNFVENTLLPDIKNYFSSIGIDINYCLREVHYDQFSQFNTLCDDTDDMYYVNIFPELNNNVGNTGLAGLALEGCCAWAHADYFVMMHELGHMFGLPHTYNNCNRFADAEPVNNNANNPADPNFCTEKPCTETGDGICDTPADANINCSPAYLYEGDCEVSIISGREDKCGIPYPLSGGEVLAKNFMAHYWHIGDTCHEFTPGQVQKMKESINNFGLTGEFTNCENNEIIRGETLTISGGNHHFIGEDFNDYEAIRILSGASVIFEECNISVGDLIFVALDSHVKFIGGTISNAAGGRPPFFITLRSLVELNGTKVNIDANRSCTFISQPNDRISVLGSWLIMENDAEIVHSNPIYLNESTLIANNFKLNSSINLFGDGMICAENGNIEGKVWAKNDSGYNGTNIYGLFQEINLKNVSLHSIETYGKEVHLEKVNILRNWTHSINEFNGICSISESDIVGNLRFIDVSNISINGSKIVFETGFTGFSALNIINGTRFNVELNNFKTIATNPNGNTVVGALFDNNSITQNRFKNNFISTTSKGVVTMGSQLGLKLLCNEFEFDNDVADFELGQINQLQTPDGFIGGPAGNLFASNVDRLAGDSPGTTYFYDQNNSKQIPIPSSQVSAASINSVIADDPSDCGQIGQGFTSNPPTNDPCLFGIYCDIPCEGETCLETCPFGIDCSSPCPPGIDCSSPCPSGIDCSSPCPPGIDCSSFEYPNFWHK